MARSATATPPVVLPSPGKFPISTMFLSADHYLPRSLEFTLMLTISSPLFPIHCPTTAPFPLGFTPLTPSNLASIARIRFRFQVAPGLIHKEVVRNQKSAPGVSIKSITHKFVLEDKIHPQESGARSHLSTIRIEREIITGIYHRQATSRRQHPSSTTKWETIRSITHKEGVRGQIHRPQESSARSDPSDLRILPLRYRV